MSRLSKLEQKKRYDAQKLLEKHIKDGTANFAERNVWRIQEKKRQKDGGSK